MTASNSAYPHPQLLDRLFAHKKTVSHVFNDVIDLHNIHHMAISRIDKEQKILVLSSAPALEFNLFTTQLWQFDRTWKPEWYRQGIPSLWDSLYHNRRYHDLYYLKQTKHTLSIGWSFSIAQNDSHYIYSFASSGDYHHCKTVFDHHSDDFYKIGQYCLNLLQPLFQKAA